MKNYFQMKNLLDLSLSYFINNDKNNKKFIKYLKINP